MKTNTENTEALLKIVEIEFPQIGHVYYLREEHQVFLTRLLLTLRKAAPEIAAMKNVVDRLAKAVNPAVDQSITSQAADLARFPLPSNAPLPVPGTGRSTHTPAGVPSTADTASSSDHKSDSAGKPASSSARLTDARRAAASRGKPGSRKAAAEKAAKGSVAPQTEPPSTPEPGTI